MIPKIVVEMVPEILTGEPPEMLPALPPEMLPASATEESDKVKSDAQRIDLNRFMLFLLVTNVDWERLARTRD